MSWDLYHQKSVPAESMLFIPDDKEIPAVENLYLSL